jgi:hypothetical protein
MFVQGFGRLGGWKAGGWLIGRVHVCWIVCGWESKWVDGIEERLVLHLCDGMVGSVGDEWVEYGDICCGGRCGVLCWWSCGDCLIRDWGIIGRGGRILWMDCVCVLCRGGECDWLWWMVDGCCCGNGGMGCVWLIRRVVFGCWCCGDVDVGVLDGVDL